MLMRLLLLAFLLFPASAAAALEIDVPAISGALEQAVEKAMPGDILRLAPGAHDGPIIISVPLTIQGGGQASVKGNNTGSTITVKAPDVVIRGLVVTGSGSDGKDAGIDLTQAATRALVEKNRLLGNLIGVNVQGARDAIVRANIIEGRQDKRMNSRGNGVYVWNAPGAKIVGNDIRWGRDGIFVNASKNNEFSHNRFRDLRFAIHYMYANDSSVIGNISKGNHLGYAIMFSNKVRIEDNVSLDDRNYGIMVNYTNNSTIKNNRIERVKDRCLFIYNAHKNVITGNLFQQCGIGINFTAGSERNEIAGNSFISNRIQVKYVGTKWVNWSKNGRGNYWSDNQGFDLNGDGIADTAYRPNDMMDQVLWSQPAARQLLGSPAVQLIRWSQSAFPALLPGGVIDTAPLMTPQIPRQVEWRNLL